MSTQACLKRAPANSFRKVWFKLIFRGHWTCPSLAQRYVKIPELIRSLSFACTFYETSHVGAYVYMSLHVLKYICYSRITFQTNMASALCILKCMKGWLCLIMGATVTDWSVKCPCFCLRLTICDLMTTSCERVTCTCEKSLEWVTRSLCLNFKKWISSWEPPEVWFAAAYECWEAQDLCSLDDNCTIKGKIWRNWGSYEFLS